MKSSALILSLCISLTAHGLIFCIVSFVGHPTKPVFNQFSTDTGECIELILVSEQKVDSVSVPPTKPIRNYPLPATDKSEEFPSDSFIIQNLFADNSPIFFPILDGPDAVLSHEF